MRSLPCVLVCIVLLYSCVHGTNGTGPSTNSEIYFNQSTYFTKNNSDFNFTLVLTSTKPLSGKITVLVKDTSTADDGSTDNGTSYNVTFPTNTFLDVSISADDLPVTFVIDSIVSSDVDVNVTVRENAYATIEHIPKTVNFAKKSYKVNENNGSVFITLVLDGSPSSSDIDVKVRIFTSDNDHTLATDKDDYNFGLRSNVVTIPAGSNTMLLSISLRNDDILEGNEIFRLMIDSTYNSDIVESRQYETVVTIIDTTVVSVRFDESTYVVNETDGIVQPVLVLNSSTAIDFTVHVNITDISATVCSDNKTGDYKPETLVVSFKEGTNSASLNISILDDNLLEDDENFILTINSSSLPSNVIVDNPSNATVTILNDDVVSVRFDELTYVVNETDGIVQPVLVLNSSTAIDFTVHVNITDISATMCSDNKTGDYKPEALVVSFKEGTNSASLNISILDDKLLEDDETFNLAIINSSSLPSNVIVDNPSAVTVTILNDDAVSVYFENPVYNISESEGTVQLALILSSPSTIDITVYLYANPSSAIPGEDYESKNEYAVIFFPSKIKAEFNISIINDALFEKDENFTVTINSSSLPNSVNISDPHSATVTIVNDDPKPIITPTTTNSTHINSVPTKNPVIGNSSSSTAAATAATTTIVPTPTISTGSTASGAFGFTSLFYTSIILLLVLVPAVYVYYQNREKIRGCLRGRSGGRAGKIKYQLLPNSVGEALRSSHRD